MRSGLLVSAVALVLAAACPVLAASHQPAPAAARAAFGKLADGRVIEAVTLSDGHGLRVRIMTLGAAIQSLEVPDRAGRAADVVLGYDTAADYLAKPKFYGATVGRYANRIAHAAFSLDGHPYQLLNNDGANLLHGGPEGFDKRVWSIVKVEGGRRPSVTLSYVSPDGEEGFPGVLKVEATYALIGHGQLALTYRATTDKPTVVNISNHSYFNLAGEGADESLLDQVLTVPAAAYTPVDAALIPTGELKRVAGTPFDFRKPTRIGLHLRDGTDQQILYGRGVDHNYVLDAGASGATGPLHLAARLADPRSGRVMEILSDQPGVQVYTGNFLDALVPGKKGHLYRQGDAICLEPQLFPDSPNQPRFPSPRLDPGKTYLNRIVYRFSTTPR